MTLAAIMSGVAGLILSGGFVEDSLHQLREATIHSQLGHLQIYRTGYYVFGSQAPYKYMINAPQHAIDQVRGLAEVDDVMARLNFSAVLRNGKADIPIQGTGIQPEEEAKLGTRITIIDGRRLAGGNPYEIILGEGVAKASKLRPGERASLLTSTRDGALNELDFDVVGVFRSFSKDYDARAVRIPLAGAQELLDVKGVNAIVVSLKRTEATNAVLLELRKMLDSREYEIKTWNQLADFYDKTVALYRRQFLVLQLIILMAVILSVANAVNMTIFERSGEFGTLMAMGNRANVILRLAIMENALLGLLGSGAGVVLGILLAWAISIVGIPMPPPPNSNSGYTALIQIVPWVVVSAFLVGFFATVVAAVLPARRAVRMPIVDALRQNQ